MAGQTLAMDQNEGQTVAWQGYPRPGNKNDFANPAPTKIAELWREKPTQNRAAESQRGPGFGDFFATFTKTMHF